MPEGYKTELVNIKSSQFIVESPSQLGLWKQNPSNWVSSESPSSHRVKSNPIITNEFLIQMDGFSQRNSVILIGATNFVHSLDKALLRPGRFDCIIKLNPPDKFLQINMKPKILGQQVHYQGSRYLCQFSHTD